MERGTGWLDFRKGEEVMITNFNELMEELHNGKTFDEVCSNDYVERNGNVVYEDSDLYDYLDSIGVSIEDYGVGFAVLKDAIHNRFYEVPYSTIHNRFDDSLPNETVLSFQWNQIYEVEN